MKTKSFIMTDGYQSPAVAKIDIAVEQGFAASGGGIEIPGYGFKDIEEDF